MPGSTPIDFVPGVGKRTAQVLHKMGVHTAGQLAHIPDGVLEHIFGPSIQAVMAYARRKNLPTNPVQFSHREFLNKGFNIKDSGQAKSLRAQTFVPVHAGGGEHLSWWKKFQLAARVVSVL